MTAGLFNQCVAKWFHTIPSWLTTETKQERFYILFKCRCHPKGCGEREERENKAVVNKLTLDYHKGKYDLSLKY